MFGKEVKEEEVITEEKGGWEESQEDDNEWVKKLEEGRTWEGKVKRKDERWMEEEFKTHKEKDGKSESWKKREQFEEEDGVMEEETREVRWYRITK